MASADLVRQSSEDDDDSGLNARQVVALEKLSELGAEPAPVDPETGKSIYDSDPKIRAFQLVYEGRFGGPNRGQGRKREPRAAEVLAGAIREEPRVKKMLRAFDRALAKKAGSRANLDAIKLGVELENRERNLQIKEEEHEDKLGNTREELLGTIFELVQQPGIASAIEAEHEDITDAEVIEEDFDRGGSPKEEERDEAPVYNFQKRRSPAAEANGDHGDSRDTRSARRNGRKPQLDGRGGSEEDRSTPRRASIAAARRRAADRR